MTAPSATSRVTPSAIPLCDGFSTLFTFAADTDLEIYEVTVQPPGIDGGDPIDSTTMHNSAWRTMCPRQLKTMTEFQITGSYDPIIYTNLDALINVETTGTVTFPDGSTLAFFCFLRSFEISEHTEGERPIVTLNIIPTNEDSTVGNFTEEGPVLTNVAGT